MLGALWTYGYKSRKTTEICAHVSNRELGKIRSPLDLYIEDVYGEKGDENKE